MSSILPIHSELTKLLKNLHRSSRPRYSSRAQQKRPHGVGVMGGKSSSRSSQIVECLTHRWGDSGHHFGQNRALSSQVSRQSLYRGGTSLVKTGHSVRAHPLSYIALGIDRKREAAIHLSTNGDALILQRGNLFRLRHASTLKRSQTDSQGAEQSGMDVKKCAVSGLIPLTKLIGMRLQRSGSHHSTDSIKCW